ncbi:hypothetical protein L227DRAFT_68386 [Lentinus tigrinus ALCF2SS1-6]|uniref:CHCH domain-containing protein n=1 Tax=Lentinus tigrinus ALCF2SS1-6 TaxID=1328759 RepID=A0A5C2SDT1_9APHY|nr:hypothetical protein L227DRAFT_68386 [Lentinus tigrinus ALCF2SS1-6]
MPSRSRAAPAARPAPAHAPQQTRGAHTMAAPPPAAAHPPAHHAPPVPPQAQATQSREPGMLAQMAATAGSVAVGSTIGHGLSNMLFGGSSSTPAAPEASAAPPVQQQSSYQPQGISCESQAKEFTKCLESADINACSWYLEQLKACQAAAARY